MFLDRFVTRFCAGAAVAEFQWAQAGKRYASDEKKPTSFPNGSRRPTGHTHACAANAMQCSQCQVCAGCVRMWTRLDRISGPHATHDAHTTSYVVLAVVVVVSKRGRGDRTVDSQRRRDRERTDNTYTFMHMYWFIYVSYYQV